MSYRPGLQQNILTLSIGVTVVLLLLSGSLAAWSTQREFTSRLLGGIERARLSPPRTAEAHPDELVLDGPMAEMLYAPEPLSGVNASRNRRFFWGAILSLLAGAFTWFRLTRLAAPRQELLREITRIQKGDVRNPVTLGPANPYRPVAETLNRLLGSLEHQSRILTELHHRQQNLLNSISEGVLVLDNDLNITGINPMAARWLDLGNPIRCHGKPLYKLCRNPTLLSLIDELLSSGTMNEAHLHLEREGDEDRILHLRGSLLIDRDQTEGVILLLQDVTTLRRLETLRQDFVANVSHELRTPLTAIKGYAELLTEEADDSETVRKYNDRILMQSERMINIIDDLLSLTRIESAHGPERVTLSEIRPILENVCQLTEDAARRRNLTLSLETEEGLTAMLHAPLFEQAVLNLVQNAVKYTHPGSTITLRAYPKQSRAVIEVQDQGPGIAPQHHSRLFERFYRVDKARSRAVGGTGLGLSIVKHIAQLHKGTVEVDSEPGKGACFRISIPLDD